MSQQWILINLDKRQWIQPQGSWVATLCEQGGYLDARQPFILPPTITIRGVPPRKNGAAACRSISLSSTVLSWLANELFDSIFESMEDYFDCICFGLTCHFLWEVARRHVRKRYEEDAPSSWIGDRVVCAGSFSSADDEFAQLLIGKKGPEWTADGSQNLFSFARQHYTEVLPRLQAIDTLNIRALRYAERRGFGFQDRKNLYAVLCPFNNCQPVVAEAESSGTGVIRNLSKKVYVREDAISWLIFGREWHNAGSIGLAAVVWLRTAWSTHDSMGLRHNPISAHQGPWAGDCLDFVANMEFLKTEVGEYGFPVAWKDESYDVIRDLIKVWERVRKEAEEDEANWAAHAGDAFNTPVNTIVDFMMSGW